MLSALHVASSLEAEYRGGGRKGERGEHDWKLKQFAPFITHTSSAGSSDNMKNGFQTIVTKQGNLEVQTMKRYDLLVALFHVYSTLQILSAANPPVLDYDVCLIERDEPTLYVHHMERGQEIRLCTKFCPQLRHGQTVPAKDDKWQKIHVNRPLEEENQLSLLKAYVGKLDAVYLDQDLDTQGRLDTYRSGLLQADTVEGALGVLQRALTEPEFLEAVRDTSIMEGMLRVAHDRATVEVNHSLRPPAKKPSPWLPTWLML